MNTILYMLGGIFWLVCIGVAVSVGHWLTERTWRRRAAARAFDALIDGHRSGAETGQSTTRISA